MYLDALEFLEEERDGWRPYEALARLTDEQLTTPVEEAHGWSGRDLIVHMLGWLEIALQIARELAVGERSAAMAAKDAEWDERGGEAVNADIIERSSSLSLAELRDRLLTVPGELRGYLTVVPETRWIKHPTHMASFMGETVEHYADHLADLEASLAAARL
ncbi:MAG: maleylpyruvate isomerase N-terminal domain-containing protein [Chloroflexi bacterium]|nr:maleylpyruvate isomerase N-terminal domain-containing protein [Chloroflexota bacterium]